MGICNSKREDYDVRTREAGRALRGRVAALEQELAASKAALAAAEKDREKVAALEAKMESSLAEDAPPGAGAPSAAATPAEPPGTATAPAPAPAPAPGLTDAMREASAAAEAYMEAVLKAAAEAPKERKEQVAYAYREYGGFKLEALALKDTDLIDIKYLIRLAELGGRVERNQDAPACAKIRPENAWRLRGWNRAFSAPYFVISYPWFDKDHPDRHGHTLRRMLPILRAVLAEAQEHGGEHATVAVMWDVMSLVQGPDRTPEQQERFERALGSINEWYMHPYSIVLAVTTPIPAGKGYTNTRAYIKRGWCYIELRMSSLVKDDSCLWDLSLHEEGKPIGFASCCLNLRRSRLPFMSPDRVARELTEGVASGALAFTAQADSELVSKIYRRAYVKALETFQEIEEGGTIFYSDLGWGSEAVPVLVEALEYAQEHCTMKERLWLNFADNQFTEADKAAIRAAIPENSTKFKIQMAWDE